MKKTSRGRAASWPGAALAGPAGGVDEAASLEEQPLAERARATARAARDLVGDMRAPRRGDAPLEPRAGRRIRPRFSPVRRGAQRGIARTRWWNSPCAGAPHARGLA